MLLSTVTIVQLSGMKTSSPRRRSPSFKLEVLLNVRVVPPAVPVQLKVLIPVVVPAVFPLRMISSSLISAIVVPLKNKRSSGSSIISPTSKLSVEIPPIALPFATTK